MLRRRLTLPMIVAATSLGGAALAAAGDDRPVRLGSKIGGDCSLGGKKLYGRVQVVDAFSDFKVQVVDAFPDLRVQSVDAFPDACGRWRFVEAFPDFKITYVDAFPDFKIKRVDAFPGLP